jgi:hypothetical protein
MPVSPFLLHHFSWQFRPKRFNLLSQHNKTKGTNTVDSPNIARTQQYLQAIASMGPFEKVADFCSPDIVVQEFPNCIVPQGRIRRAADLSAAYEQGHKILANLHSAAHLRSRRKSWPSWNGLEFSPSR